MEKEKNFLELKINELTKHLENLDNEKIELKRQLDIEKKNLLLLKENRKLRYIHQNDFNTSSFLPNTSTASLKNKNDDDAYENSITNWLSNIPILSWFSSKKQIKKDIII